MPVMVGSSECQRKFCNRSGFNPSVFLKRRGSRGRCDVMNDVNVSSKSNKHKKFEKTKKNFIGILKVTDEKPDPDLFVRSTNPRIRIRTKNVTDPKHSHISTVPGTSGTVFSPLFRIRIELGLFRIQEGKRKVKKYYVFETLDVLFLYRE
jgi:hypothetical protein